MSFLLDDLERGLDRKVVDVTFHVGYDLENVECIQANTAILRQKSPVFDIQFSESWIKNELAGGAGGNSVAKKRKISTSEARGSDNEVEIKGNCQEVDKYKDLGLVIEIPDANPTAFRSFLKHLYDDGLDICKIEDIVGVYYLGVKYDVVGLTDACLEFLKENLTKDNVLDVLEEACKVLYKPLEEIQAECFKYFTRFSEQLIESEEFAGISINVLKAIVNLNKLGVGEAELLKGVLKWASAEYKRRSMDDTHENIRSVLGPDVFYNIRFLSISDYKKTKGLAGIIWGPDGILTNEEQLSLLRLEKLGVGEVTDFNTNPRQVSLCRAVERFRGADPLREWTAEEMNRERNTCCFVTNREANLVGFGFYGSLSTPNAKYEFIIEIQNKYMEDVIVTCKRVCAEPGKIITVFLDKSILVMRGKTTISYSMKGPPTFTSNRIMKRYSRLKNFFKDEQDLKVEFDNYGYNINCHEPEDVSYNHAPENVSYNQLPVIYFGSWEGPAIN